MKVTGVDVSYSGAVKLGDEVACDGYLPDAKSRVQTHVHLDHMQGFATSKGEQVIIASPATVELLTLQDHPDLKYRSNVRALTSSDSCTIGHSKITLTLSGHMLGAAQVAVELPGGTRIGYSGDLQWPLNDVIQVDWLVVDSTSGKSENVRKFSQGTVEAQLMELVSRLLGRGPVHIVGYRGSLHRALQLLTGELDETFIGSPRLRQEVQIYRDFGYTIGEIVSSESADSVEVFAGDRYIRWYGTGDAGPADIGNGSQIKLSAYFTVPDNPVVEYSDRAFGVALSNHADFEGTLEYIRRSGASYVVTDNSRHGKGVTLAQEIRQQLNIESRPSSNFRVGHIF